MAEEYDQMEVDEEVQDQQDDGEDDEAFEAADEELEEDDQPYEDSRESEEPAEVCGAFKARPGPLAPPPPATTVLVQLTIGVAVCRRMQLRCPKQRSSA